MISSYGDQSTTRNNPSDISCFTNAASIALERSETLLRSIHAITTSG